MNPSVTMGWLQQVTMAPPWPLQVTCPIAIEHLAPSGTMYALFQSFSLKNDNYFLINTNSVFVCLIYFCSSPRGSSATEMASNK